MKVTIADYGLGNITSVQRAFERVGAETLRTGDPKDISRAEALAVPGVGAFRQAMVNLERLGLTAPLMDYLSRGRPYLGICLGMQILFSESLEYGHHSGLDIIPGRVGKITGDVKIPHMGWNRVEPEPAGSEMFNGIPGGEFFYFDHSFCAVPREPDAVAAVTEYGGSIVSAVSDGKIWGVQFHPEKSAAPGLKLIENFLKFSEEA